MKYRNLYISYNGLLEEIVPSQVIPYLRELAKERYRFILLTFEKKQQLTRVGKKGITKLKNEVKDMGIEWYWLRYHKKMPLLATSFDVLLGAAVVLYLVINKKVRVIHARSIVPAAMALVPELFGVGFVFDTRGLLAEEYVGGGHWKEGGLKYRIVKFFEKFCLRHANSIVVLTERHREYLLGLPFFKNKDDGISIEVIPCCVDLDRFKYQAAEVNFLRDKENLRNSFVFTYLGKIGKHYMFKEMIAFFKNTMEVFPTSKLMIITQHNQQELLKIILNNSMDSEKVIIRRPSFEEIPCLISLANAGLFFINPYKKFGSSPIKLGEFLSCGVPVIINSGIGDTEELVKTNKVGVVVDDFNDNSYKRALFEFVELYKEGEVLRQRCRKAAEDLLSLEKGVKRYSSIYRQVLKCTA